MTTSQDREDTDLTLRTVPSLLAMLGTALGVGGYGVGAVGAGAASAAAEFANNYRDRKERRRSQRFKAIVENTEARVTNLEDTFYGDEEIDLFLEVVGKAIDDDEEQKAQVYEAVLEWMLCEHPHCTKVKILSDAVRGLSYLEIYCFLKDMAGRYASKDHKDLVPENVLRNRLSRFGLSQGATVTMEGSPTVFGTILAKYAHLDELEPPST